MSDENLTQIRDEDASSDEIREQSGRKISPFLKWILLGGGGILFIVLAVYILLGTSWLTNLSGGGADNDTNLISSQSSESEKNQLWTCSMHPQVLQDHPGTCPICGMDLVPVRSNESLAPESPSPGRTSESGSGITDRNEVAHVSTTSKTQLWTCGMHPQVLQDHPGTCPICGMDLVPVRSNESPSHDSDSSDMTSTSKSGKGKVLFYRSPMDPSLTSPEPRKDEMGMDYVPVYAEESGPMESKSASGPEVSIDPTIIQNMNVKSTPVIRRDISHQIRTVGYLDFDQKKLVSVTTKYSGYIEKVFVNYIGQIIRKGEPLFQIYSPELVQTEQELLSAVHYVSRMKDSPAESLERANALLTAVRTRMMYWDITADQIEAIEESGTVLRTLTVVAPSSGIVIKRMEGLEGMAVKPGMELMQVSDIRTLWLNVEVFENQLPWVNIGSVGQIDLASFPGESFTGRVRYIDPRVSEKTRTIRLAMEVPNPEETLRAGMYATVQFEPVVAKSVIAIPSQAVLRTGERNIIIVDRGNGHFSPREVELGSEGDGHVQVLSGLQGDELVVTSAQFLIDSESNLRAVIQQLIASRTAKATETNHAR